MKSPITVDPERERLVREVETATVAVETLAVAPSHVRNPAEAIGRFAVRVEGEESPLEIPEGGVKGEQGEELGMCMSRS